MRLSLDVAEEAEDEATFSTLRRCGQTLRPPSSSPTEFKGGTWHCRAGDTYFEKVIGVSIGFRRGQCCPPIFGHVCKQRPCCS